MTNNKSNTNLKPKIKSAFRQAGGYVTRKDIGKAIRLRREDRPEFDRIIAAMIARGELREKEDKLMLAEKPDTLVKAVVVKVNPTFGFAKPDEAEEDVFIAGRRMMGAMPGDTVLLRLRKDRQRTHRRRGHQDRGGGTLYLHRCGAEKRRLPGCNAG